MPDFADDPTTELERKARALSVVALTETITYCVLFYFWLIQPNIAGKAITGSVHGMVWLTFCAMVIMIAKDMGWTWAYVAVAIITGPIGGLLVWSRLRREGVPDTRPAATNSHHASRESRD